MSKISVLILLAIFLLSVTVMSCTPKKENVKTLNKVLENYHRMIKFNDLELAAQLINSQRHESFYDDTEKLLKDIDITDIRIRSVTFNEDSSEARVVIIREYFNKSTLEVHTKTIKQTWEKKGDSWMFIEGDF